MKSFAYWFLAAIAFGALLGTMLNPGPGEILITLAVACGLLSFWRRGSRMRRAESVA